MPSSFQIHESKDNPFADILKNSIFIGRYSQKYERPKEKQIRM